MKATSKSEFFPEHSQLRPLDENNIIAFYNKLHDVNRFFMKAEGEEAGASGDGPSAPGEEDDLFGNDLEDELSVFKNNVGDDTDLVK